MAVFNPRTFPEILSEMASRLIATTPLTDINIGSVWTTMLEAAAQEDDEQYFQMLEIIRGYSLDTTTGEDLENRAFEYGIQRLGAQTASTLVTLGDSSITKIETGVYSGLPGAPAGQMTINADGSSGFPVSGSIVVGRGTPNVETVPYTSITDNGNYVTFNLGAALGFDHGTDETVILSQGGNRLFTAGTIVKVPAGDLSPEINFSLDDSATILDGERVVENVSVTASIPGSSANVPIGSIQEFASPPFGTAFVTNPSRVTNGKDVESDQELRDRIKATIQSLSRGTRTSIITGATGIVSAVDNKRVVSASLVEPTSPADVVRLYIDDGTGFVATSENVGVEEVVVAATGGEKFLQVNNFPLVKASVESQNEEPYNITAGQTLFVEVGGASETITFQVADIAIPGSVTAQEVVNKINSAANNFEARVSNAGTKVRIFARQNFDEQIKVAGGTANTALNFPLDIKFTTKLYLLRDNVLTLLSKDGTTASIESGLTAGYNMAGFDHNLAIVVDGKADNVLNTFFVPADFVNPASATAGEIVSKIDAQVPGIKALVTSGNTRVTLTSNSQRTAVSQVKIVENFDSAFLYNGVMWTNITADIRTNVSNQTLFPADNNFLYVGHESARFETIFFALATPASAPVVRDFEYWNGSAWTALGAFDGTLGFTQNGIIYFKAPYNWTKNSVNSVGPYYWVRFRRNMVTLTTPPVESRIKVCSANERFGFSEVPSIGSNRDYTLNRFVGQIEMVDTLLPGDNISIGTFNTRAYVFSSQGTFNLSGGEVLNVTVDGVAQTVTFQVSDFLNPGSASPAEVVSRINKDLVGATAELISSNTRVKLYSNKWAGGTIQVTGGSANTPLQFSLASQQSLVSHVPSVESAVGPFTFGISTSIVVIMDGNSANNFTIPLFRSSTLTAAASPSNVSDTSLTAVFLTLSQLQGYDFLITSKYFSVIQDITYTSTNANRGFISITYTGGGTAGSEVVTVSGLNISIQIENGVSTATQIKAAFDGSSSAVALAAATISGVGSNTQTIVSATFLAAARRTITSYTVSTGNMILSSALPFAPAIGDTYEVQPNTAVRVVDFWNNKQITLISVAAEVKLSSGGTKIQLASLAAGEDASVQVTGGTANPVLSFPVSRKIGVDGYKYYTGLAQVVQWTIDGKTDDSETYPGIRAAGVQVDVLEPVTKPIRIELDVTTREGVTLASIGNDVKSAVSTYVNNLAVGADVILSEIIVAVKGVTGVFDVTVVLPSANVAIGDNELARIKESNIVVG